MPSRSPDAALLGRLAASLADTWSLRARAEQLAPLTFWDVWLILAGRGWGKTRTGAEWVLAQALAGTVSRIALVAPTAADARDTMVEGVSGILTIAPNHFRPEYEPSKRRLTFPNGVIATTFSADEPERLRGPQHDAAWVDELGSWRYLEAWDQLLFGLRGGANPQVLVTTTPRPNRVLRELVEREGQGVVITRGRTRDNAENLAPGFIEAIEARYGGTRLGRQELDGELLLDVPGALWTRDSIDQNRRERAPDLKRIVVAVDPSVSNTERSDETGIIVAGICFDGHIFVLADLTVRAGPLDWSRKAVAAYHAYKADRIIAEVNNGGLLVQQTIRTVDPLVPFKAVTASRGKVTRAEPVAALYEQGKAHHCGTFNELEDQLTSFTSDFDRKRAGYSPDRLDALVWACSELGVRAPSPVAETGFYVVKRGPLPGEVFSPLSKATPPDWFTRGDRYPPGDFRWRMDFEKGLLSIDKAMELGFIEKEQNNA